MSESLELANSDWLEISNVGVRILRTPDLETYLDTVWTWGHINKLSAWALGDLLNFGEKAYGETYAQAMDMTKLSYGRLANLKSVSAAYDIEQRFEDLSISHHATVQKLEPETRQRLLQMALDESMNRDQFRRLAREKETLPASDGQTNQVVLPDLHTAVIDYIEAVETGNNERAEHGYELLKEITQWSKL